MGFNSPDPRFPHQSNNIILNLESVGNAMDLNKLNLKLKLCQSYICLVYRIRYSRIS